MVHGEGWVEPDLREDVDPEDLGAAQTNVPLVKDGHLSGRHGASGDGQPHFERHRRRGGGRRRRGGHFVQQGGRGPLRVLEFEHAPAT